MPSLLVRRGTRGLRPGSRARYQGKDFLCLFACWPSMRVIFFIILVYNFLFRAQESFIGHEGRLQVAYCDCLGCLVFLGRWICSVHCFSRRSHLYSANMSARKGWSWQPSLEDTAACSGFWTIHATTHLSHLEPGALDCLEHFALAEAHWAHAVPHFVVWMGFVRIMFFGSGVCEPLSWARNGKV